MKKKAVFLLVIFAPILGISMVGLNLYYHIFLWEYSGKDATFEIGPGETFSKINAKLMKRNLISSGKLFHRYSKFQGKLTKFKIGKYTIPSKTNMVQVLSILTSGKSITIKVTIPEGKNLFQIAEILENKKITNAKNFIQFSKDINFIKSLGIPAKRVEGYLYPDTYQFTENSKAKTIIKSMVQTFRRKTQSIDFKSSNLSKHQVVILASVVEKETGARFERPIIAGVFHNRLKKKMRLQSDPTTIYGIWENFNGNLRKKHLREKTPYNTYKIPALPIGPISNPGIESIKAVLNPKKHSYLYFVSQNDGTHIFSKNYKDHSKAVDTYQKNRKARAGKSWRDLND